MKKVVLAGGTGNLGRLLTQSFVELGYEVTVLSRQEKESQQNGIRYVKWDGQRLGEWVNSLEGADVLINLCGESIAKRLTPANKRLLRDSRIMPTRLLGEAVRATKIAPKLWINFSGISIFEDVDGVHDEESRRFGKSFLAELTKEWEHEFSSSEVAHTRKVIMRISPVLNRHAGMFHELKPLVKWGLGGKVGKGNQYISWIHERDFVRLVQWIVNSSQPSSLYHVCSPNPEMNAKFMQQFRKAVGMPLGLPLPVLLARVGSWLKGVDAGLLLGSVATTSRVVVEEGFHFEFPVLGKALENLLLSSKK